MSFSAVLAVDVVPDADGDVAQEASVHITKVKITIAAKTFLIITMLPPSIIDLTLATEESLIKLQVYTLFTIDPTHTGVRAIKEHEYFAMIICTRVIYICVTTVFPRLIWSVIGFFTWLPLDRLVTYTGIFCPFIIQTIDQFILGNAKCQLNAGILPRYIHVSFHDRRTIC